MKLSYQLFRFAVVGLLGTAMQYLVLWLGVEFFSMPAALASGIGYVLGSMSNYILNYLFTFASGKSHVDAASKYFTVLGIGLVINVGLMALFADHLGWNHWWVQITTTGLVFFWNFAGSRWWAFKSHA